MISGIIYINQNYCSIVFKDSCELKEIKKIWIGVSDDYLSNILWDPVRKKITVFNWYDNESWKLTNDEESKFEMYENIYMLSDFIVSTYSNIETKLVECFYVLETSGKKGKIATNYSYLWSYWDQEWKKKWIILNKTKLSKLNTFPYISFVSYFPAAYWGVWILTQSYWWFELYYNYIIYWNIWWDMLSFWENIEDDLVNISDWTEEQDMVYVMSLDVIPEKAKNAYISVSNQVPINMYGIWTEYCIDNKVLPARKRDFWFLPNVIKEFRDY